MGLQFTFTVNQYYTLQIILSQSITIFYDSFLKTIPFMQILLTSLCFANSIERKTETES